MLNIDKELYNLKLIENFMKENKQSKAEFCRKCGVSRDILDRVYFGHLNIRIRELAKIANYMQVPVVDLFKNERL